MIRCVRVQLFVSCSALTRPHVVVLSFNLQSVKLHGMIHVSKSSLRPSVVAQHSIAAWISIFSTLLLFSAASDNPKGVVEQTSETTLAVDESCASYSLHAWPQS